MAAFTVNMVEVSDINKNIQTIKVFQDIIAPLRENFGLSFGYMIVFDDGYYYPLVEDIKFLTNFIENVKKSSVFCQNDITNSSDAEYRFTLWPNHPLDEAMQICYDHGIWNGITVSLMQKNFIELWWFTGNSHNTRDFFARNKEFLIKFIHYFNCHKEKLFISENMNKENLFKFEEGFLIKDYSYFEDEKEKIRNFLKEIQPQSFTLKTAHGVITLSLRHIQLLSLIASGLTAKLAAEQMNITARTVRHNIENIKIKTHLNHKTGLINFYADHCKRFFEF